ncbi:MAG: 3-deoxy-manno-octulosonate cytidylyltransferase [Desulfovibrionaceae bacterium]
MKRHVTYGVIPARYGSSRFPGKPLADILGKPMFWHVYRRAAQCAGLDQLILATDDARILDAARALDVPALMTRADHASGTDRVLEAARAMGAGPEAVVVNIQGDEPALDPGMLDELLAPFADPTVRTATLAAPLDPAEAQSPDRVKVALAKDGRALYFSRAPIPYDRDGTGAGFLLHLGLYAFRMEALERFAALPPSPLEQRERLEQLRLLENGIPMHVRVTTRRCHGVDRPEDLAAITEILREHTP